VLDKVIKLGCYPAEFLTVTIGVSIISGSNIVGKVTFYEVIKFNVKFKKEP
jgi:hypothetical protein